MKCDETKPSCLNCAKRNRPCVYTDSSATTFVPSTTEFDNVSQRNGDENGSSFLDDRTSNAPQFPVDAVKSPSTVNLPRLELSEGFSTGFSIHSILQHYNKSPDTSPLQSRVAEIPRSPSPAFGQGARTRIRDHQTARLMRHYVEVVGPWLDMTDGQNHHFSTIIPERAFESPVLLYAILAFSARQLSRLGQMDPVTADYYHHKCVKDMIPLLKDTEGVRDGKLLAATVILRMYEMLESSSEDLERHLLGSSSLISLESYNESWDSLRKAAFWIFLRQDILWAEKNRRCTIINLDKSFVGGIPLFSDATDDTWANRIYYLLAKVINLCYGQDSISPIEWHMTLHNLENWRRRLPSSFEPYFYLDPDSDESNPFPAIWLLCDWHVCAIQSFHMAKLLLYLHSPGFPKGIHGLIQMRKFDEEILYNARMVCGISVTNKCESALISSTQQLTIAGSCLVSTEQKLMVTKVLEDIESRTSWPVAACIESLHREWGWSTGQPT